MSEIRGISKHIIVKFQNLRTKKRIPKSPKSPKTMEKMISKLEFCTQTKYQSTVKIENSNSFRYASFPQIYFLEPFLRKLLEIALHQNEGVD